MAEEEREVFFRFMVHSGEISKNIYSCRPILKTLSLLSRILKTLDLNRKPDNNRQCSSLDSVTLTSKVSRRERPLVIESHTEEEKESVPQSKRLRWDAEDSRKKSLFKGVYNPQRVKCVNLRVKRSEIFCLRILAPNQLDLTFLLVTEKQ